MKNKSPAQADWACPFAACGFCRVVRWHSPLKCADGRLLQFQPAAPGWCRGAAVLPAPVCVREEGEEDSYVFIYVYMYIYIYTHIHTYVYI